MKLETKKKLDDMAKKVMGFKENPVKIINLTPKLTMSQEKVIENLKENALSYGDKEITQAEVRDIGGGRVIFFLTTKYKTDDLTNQRIFWIGSKGRVEEK